MPLRRVTGSWKDKAKKIDYVGSFLILAGSISLLIPISWWVLRDLLNSVERGADPFSFARCRGGTEYAWDSVAVVLVRPVVSSLLWLR